LGFASDERSYEVVDFILKHYGITKINLLTNNPDKLNKIAAEVILRIPIMVGQTAENANYLSVKKEMMGHLL